jgi:hypothetical protein
MDSYKLAVKFPFATPSAFRPRDLVPVFHRWIQSQALPGHQLIDVADYDHVHEGPGIVLVSHEANLHADQGMGKPGLLYRRKHPIPGSFRDRLRSTFTHALQAAALLESDAALAGRANVHTHEGSFLIFDRLLAPNTPQTFQSVRSELEAFLKELYGVPSIKLTYVEKPEELFEVAFRSARPVPASTLLERASATAAA